MTRIVGSVGPLAIGAALLLSACSGHSAANPTTTPPISSLEQVTSSAVTTTALPTASLTPPSSTASSQLPTTSTTSRTVSSPSSKASPTSALSAPSDQRFTWTVDYKLVPKTAAVAAMVKAAVPIYQGFMATYDLSLQAPKSRNWEPVMTPYAGGQALSVWRTGWESNANLGAVQKGDTLAVGRVIGVGKDVLSMRACIDASHVKVVDPTGHVLPLAKGVPTKGYAWLLTIQRGSDGQIRVVDFRAQTPSGKTISC